MKTTKTILTVLLAAAAFAGISQNSFAATEIPDEDMTTKTIPVANFNSLVCNIPCDVIYKIGDPSVEVIAPVKVAEHVVAAVKDSTLTLSMDTKNVFKYRGIQVTVYSRALCNVILKGAVDFRAREGVSAEDFSIECNGAAAGSINGLNAQNVYIKLNGAGGLGVTGIDSKSVKATVNGAGGCTLSGQTGKAELILNGAGAIKAKELKADKIYPTLHGVGTIETYRED